MLVTLYSFRENFNKITEKLLEHTVFEVARAVSSTMIVNPNRGLKLVENPSKIA